MFRDLGMFSFSAWQHDTSSQFLSVDSARAGNVFQTWVPQVHLIPRPWKIFRRAGKSLKSLWTSRWLRLQIMITEKVEAFCSRYSEIFLILFFSFTGSNQTRRLIISFTNDIDNIFTERQPGRRHIDDPQMTRDSKTQSLDKQTIIEYIDFWQTH